MQGFIIDVKSVRDDDLIVTLLTDHHIYRTYRFYGARHSNINIGFKIDFELETTLKSNMPRLKDVLQLGFPWILDRDKLYAWQRFIKLFHMHFLDVEEIDDFYFNLGNKLIQTINKQNVKRAIIEGYLELLEYEGRLHHEFICLLCDGKIKDDISLVRSFHPVHASCTYSKNFEFKKVKALFKEKSLIAFDDEEIDYLWSILLQGL